MNRSKNFIKTFVFAFAFLLTLALTLGITGAWYNTRRQADGVITMSDGIVIDYSGFGQGSGEWQNNSADFLLFATNNEAGPGTTATLNAAGIKAGSGSADFFVRAKLEYKFFTDVEGLTEVTSQIADYSAFVNTPTFAQGWVDSGLGDGWFYYATGSTFNTLPSADYVNVFTPGQSITLNGDAEGFNHQGGGYKYSDEILIKRVTVVLTLEAYQANQTAAANAGWEISPLVENSNSQVVEIYSNQITLGNVGGSYKLGTGEAGSLAYDTATLGTTLKIAVAGDSQINANAFENSGLEEIYIGDQDYINGVSSYAARIYSSPATFIIGSNAFAGCTNLKLYLSSGVNYTIYTNALPSGATVYYNGSTISLPTSAGAVGGTNITMATPSIVSGGSGGGAGSVSVSPTPSYGDYTYEDAQGNIWYFDLGALTELDLSWQSANEFIYQWNTDNTNGTQAVIRRCSMVDDNTSNQTLTFPSMVTSGELIGNINVTCIFGSGWEEGHNIFSCPSLVGTISIPNSIEKVSGYCFENCPITSLTFPNSVKEISYGACYGCSTLSSVTLPSYLRTLGDGAFKNCTSLTSITIPDTLTRLESGAFTGCTNLSSIIADSEYFVSACDNKVLIGLSSNDTRVVLKDQISGAITLPDTVKYIEYFQGCVGLTSINIPSAAVRIGGLSAAATGPIFSGCTNLASFTGGSERYIVSSDGRCLIETQTNADSEFDPNATILGYNLIAFASAGFSGEYTGIPDYVTGIGGGVFKNCTTLTGITIPDSVEFTYYNAFAGCTGLVSITLPSLITHIWDGLFEGCTNLSSVTMLGNITEIGGYTFKNCTNLTSITIPNTVQSIGSSAFEGSGLTSISLPDSICRVEYGAFKDCTSLETVTLNGSSRNEFVIYVFAFRNCTSLENVYFNGDWSGITVTIDEHAFYDCNNNILNVHIPNQ